MKKHKKGFTLIETIIAVALLVILFIALYDLYIKNLVIHEDNWTKAKVEIDVKNFSDSLYSYIKGAEQTSIKVIKNEEKESLFMVLPLNENYYMEFMKKNDYIEIISGRDQESKTSKALEGIVKSFTLEPLYSEGVLSKLTVIIEYDFGKGKIDEIVLDYTIRN